MTRDPFPLQWPEAWPRATSREVPKFASNFTTDRDTIYRWLGKRGANVVITSNLPLTTSLKPMASGNVSDPGIACWWVERGAERVIACDRWRTVGHNLHAIMLSLQALRGLERWGASELVNRAFEGFRALPAGEPIVTARSWREVIGGAWPEGLAPGELLTLAKQRFRVAMSVAHPDRGGATDRAAELNLAMDQARQELEP